MPEIWGLLPKSTTSAETIDESVSAAIAAHEADEEAHLGAGESLLSHKAEAIIDHVAGSILGDKLSMTEYQAKIVFEALDKWTVTGNVQNDVWPGVVLWSDYSPANPAKLVSKDSSVPDYVDWSKGMTFQVVASVAETVNKRVYMGHGVLSGTDMHDGFGFEIVNGTLYGYLDADGTIDTVVLAGVDLYVTHCYRAQWDPAEKMCYYFIDGVQAGSLEVASTSGTGDGTIRLHVEATASGECYLYVYELFTAREI